LNEGGSVAKVLALLYGLVSYALFLSAFLYTIGFLANTLVPKSIDSGTPGLFGESLLINLVLLGLFAVQHTIMARQGFKKAWTRIIPAVAERSTFVLVSSLILVLMFWQWRPMPDIVWDIQNQIGRSLLMAVGWIGWLTVLLSTFAINHFDLFGLRQVALFAGGKQYAPLRFTAGGIYSLVRHPIMLGFIIAFWATPTMTVGHLVFAIATTGYTIMGIMIEERDLVKAHPSYADYRKRVPMLIPLAKAPSDAKK
jgi:protein-S-isoprenylcysteine O-methyltransferase Ste14